MSFTKSLAYLESEYRAFRQKLVDAEYKIGWLDEHIKRLESNLMYGGECKQFRKEQSLLRTEIDKCRGDLAELDKLIQERKHGR